ncbi:hypothetical protein EXN66_Car006204 [Channa argus]|uniref:Uncharacterized protein n=1 Tax=Channa argus TaxID=215402 RepID=A0A6G1PJM1_CHAAH|nr:hypothetical protein EXN66_Car006204 [Channa argus]
MCFHCIIRSGRGCTGLSHYEHLMVSTNTGKQQPLGLQPPRAFAVVQRFPAGRFADQLQEQDSCVFM